MRLMYVIAFIIALPLWVSAQSPGVVVTKYAFNGELSPQDKEVVIKHIKKMVGLKHAIFCNDHNWLYTEQILSASQTNAQASLKNILKEYQRLVINYEACPIAQMHACENNKNEKIIFIKR